MALRRGELGLSREQVAERAGVSVSYLQYVEEQPAEVGIGSLLRIADALRTTAGQLRGGDVDLPQGRGRAGARPTLVELSPEECWDRLGTHGVGRVAVFTEAGPLVVPVNYTVLGGAIVYRTTWNAAADAAGHAIAFEIDRVDEALSEGWSVVAAGRTEHITDPDRARSLDEHAFSEPWAGGDRPEWVRLVPERLTGRRIHSG
ncbi:pyridoxamine 5'-phosphate oxidase family protein [Streptomyces sp. ICBB 8177]|uniref:helix-turn-helix domain-containing protein n=1 Tax=Streptomyces sp. ICBB 8177 TaxID=563922 RepID=UPI001F547AAE|nr:pyridoxamine 5'-phosphate oxidase family protein [Streptomyces sp. ICBB 8177]